MSRLLHVLGKLSDALRLRRLRTRATPERYLARFGEAAAHRFLQRRGYRVIAANHKVATGNELDLIAWHGERLVFIEVKTRAVDHAGTPERAVTPDKQRRIALAARQVCSALRVDPERARFDVVAVTGDRKPVVELFEDAFGLSSSV